MPTADGRTMNPIPPDDPEAHVARLREIYARLSELNEISDTLAAEITTLRNEVRELNRRPPESVVALPLWLRASP
jgi:hypothetical protein